MKKQHIIIYFLSALFIPSLTFAFDLFNTTFSGVVGEVIAVINILLPILSGLAFIYFFWGLSKFILNSNKPEEIKNGKNKMFWGILALFVLLSYQAIVRWVSNDLGIGPSVPSILLPTGPSTP